MSDDKHSEITEQVKANLLILTDTESADPLSEIKEIVCVFNQKGNNPICKACIQPDFKLNECKDWYMEKIPHRPMLEWEPTFDLLEVREKKKVSQDQFNTLACDTCYLSKSCPEFKAMSTCAIDWSPDTDVTDPKNLIDSVIRLQQERIKIARAAELADGGIPDQNLSNEMDRFTGLVSMKNEMNQDKFSLKIEASQQNNGNGKGILSQLFGGMAGNNQPALEQNQPIQIEEAKAQVLDLSKLSNPEFAPEKEEGKRRGSSKIEEAQIEEPATKKAPVKTARKK